MLKPYCIIAIPFVFFAFYKFINYQKNQKNQKNDNEKKQEKMTVNIYEFNDCEDLDMFLNTDKTIFNLKATTGSFECLEDKYRKVFQKTDIKQSIDKNLKYYLEKNIILSKKFIICTEKTIVIINIITNVKPTSIIMKYDEKPNEKYIHISYFQPSIYKKQKKPKIEY